MMIGCSPFLLRSRPTLVRMGIYCRTTKGLGSTDAHQREARRTYIMAEDTKNIRNQPPGSQSRLGIEWLNGQPIECN